MKHLLYPMKLRSSMFDSSSGQSKNVGEIAASGVLCRLKPSKKKLKAKLRPSLRAGVFVYLSVMLVCASVFLAVQRKRQT